MGNGARKLKNGPRIFDARQTKFIQAFLAIDSPTRGNVVQSGIVAGYSPKYAARLNDPGHGEAWIAEVLQTAGGTDLELTVDMIVRGIYKETTNEKPEVRLRAWELLGKHKKMFAEQIEFPNGAPRYIVMNVDPITPKENGPQDAKGGHEGDPALSESGRLTEPSGGSQDSQ